LLAAVGNWTALGIENANLHNNARRLAVLEERERIGMDLHDGIIQSIFGIGLSLDNICHSLEKNPQHAKQRIQRVIDDLNQSIRDIRAYILDLSPRQLNGEGVMEGLKRLVTEFGANTPVEAILTSPKEDISDLTQNCALALFHICQEAIANVAKHADAKHVNVDVWATPERVLMEIRDDGKGFNVDKMNVALGHGLANMQTRIHNVGGEIDITSIPGEGTTVLAWVPRMLIP
jgi:signal transduction histidine kinase